MSIGVYRFEYEKSCYAKPLVKPGRVKVSLPQKINICAETGRVKQLFKLFFEQNILSERGAKVRFGAHPTDYKIAVR